MDPQLINLAGPIATVFAAGAAAFVAYRLGKSQIAVAKTQADIAQRNWETANERVVLELFEKRLAIYEKETRPVMDYYGSKRVHTIDATQTPVNVLRDILRVIAKI